MLAIESAQKALNGRSNVFDEVATQLSGDTSEDCCEYNMMKLTRHVFSWSPRAEHMDYYEQLMFNHRLGTIDPEIGTTVYFVPVGGGYSKIFANPSIHSGAVAVRARNSLPS